LSSSKQARAAQVPTSTPAAVTPRSQLATGLLQTFLYALGSGISPGRSSTVKVRRCTSFPLHLPRSGLLLSHSLLLSTSVMGKAKCLTNLNFFHIPPTFQSPARRPSCGVPGLRFAIPGSKSSPRKIDPKRMSSAQVWRHSGQRA
jgi:hypothetical protein